VLASGHHPYAKRPKVRKKYNVVGRDPIFEAHINIRSASTKISQSMIPVYCV